MSILNRPSDGLLTVLLALRRTLIAYGPLNEDRLLGLCAPPSVVSDGNMARKTLTRWGQLGVLRVVAGRVSLAPELESIEADDLGAVRRILLRTVLTSSNNPTFGDERDGGDRDERDGEAETKKDAKDLASDFTRAAAWMLSQDPYAVTARWKGEIERLQAEQGVSPRVFANDTRWAGFAEWAAFLGIATLAARNLVLDPTFAVESALDEVFAGSPELAQEAFFSRLADAIPVLDGGRYRAETEACIARPWRKMQPNEVSPSLSLALLHLDASGALRLESRSDAPHRGLLGRAGRELRTLSHVVRTKVSL